jgi:hypothetical protein
MAARPGARHRAFDGGSTRSATARPRAAGTRPGLQRPGISSGSTLESISRAAEHLSPGAARCYSSARQQPAASVVNKGSHPYASGGASSNFSARVHQVSVTRMQRVRSLDASGPTHGVGHQADARWSQQTRMGASHPRYSRSWLAGGRSTTFTADPLPCEPSSSTLARSRSERGGCFPRHAGLRARSVHHTLSRQPAIHY